MGVDRYILVIAALLIIFYRPTNRKFLSGAWDHVLAVILKIFEFNVGGGV